MCMFAVASIRSADKGDMKRATIQGKAAMWYSIFGFIITPIIAHLYLDLVPQLASLALLAKPAVWGIGSPVLAPVVTLLITYMSSLARCPVSDTYTNVHTCNGQ